MDKQDMVRAVKRVGANGAHFQFRQVRDTLGVKSDDKNESNRVYNLLKEIASNGIVEEVPGNRKRNRYYRVADEEKLRQQASGGSPTITGVPGKVSGAPERLVRIEQNISLILERLETIDTNLSQFMAGWR